MLSAGISLEDLAGSTSRVRPRLGNVRAISGTGPTYRIRIPWQTRLLRAVVQPIAKLLRLVVWSVFRWNPIAISFWLCESGLLLSAMATLSQFRILDRLQQAGPQTASELARWANVDEDALLRLLRAVSAVGLLKRLRDDRFELNPVSNVFCSDSKMPLGAWSQLSMRFWPILSRLPDAMRTGEPVIKVATGGTCWDYMTKVPDGTELHDRAMTAFTEAVVDVIAASYDFSWAKTLVDVGGGRGALATACLRTAPHLHGTVYDREHTRLEAAEHFQQMGVADRACHVSGNFFESVPPGADVYLIKHVLHDWDDEHARRILRSIRAAIPEHGRLLIIEGAVDHDLWPGASVRAVWDLSQWVSTWGKSRTLDGFNDLLQSVGFRLENVHVTPTIDAHILEAAPI